MQLKEFLTESKIMFFYAIPIMFCQAGFMSLGMVDAAMLGQLGIAELSASGVARAIFWPITVFFIGILFSVDVLASHSLGARRKQDLSKIFISGIQLALGLSIILIFLLLILANFVGFLGFDKLVGEYAQVYLVSICFGLPFLMLTAAIQRFCLSQGFIKPFVLIVILSNILNYFANKALIFGNYGFMERGIEGAAMATNISRVFICLLNIIIAFFIFKNPQSHLKIKFKEFFVLQKKNIIKMLKIGIPAGGQQIFEVCLFSLLTLFAAQLALEQTAAHHILIMIISFSYMFPLGLANAASFRVGKLIGEGNIQRARLAGFSAIFLGFLLMSFACIFLLVCSGTIFLLFTNDQKVIGFANYLVFLAILCQILDAIQGCTIGVLRGAGDSSFAFYACAIGYYPIALLLSAILCFWFKMGLIGLWLGLCLGLGSVSILVVSYWLNFKPKLLLIATHE